jgi:glutathione S-transferase
MAGATVYGSRVSPFVEKVARALQIKKVSFDLVEPQTPFDLRRWNPQTGKIPVVELNGERLYDSTFILRRLDELFPEPPLLSEDPQTAAMQRQLEDWADESLYWYVMALRWTEKNGRASANQIVANAPSLARPVARAMVRRRIAPTARAQGLGRLPEDILLRELAGRLDDLQTILGDRPFFFADQPSAADLAIYGMFSCALSGPTPEVNRLVGERPGLAQWMKRVEQASAG